MSFVVVFSRIGPLWAWAVSARHRGSGTGNWFEQSAGSSCPWPLCSSFYGRADPARNCSPLCTPQTPGQLTCLSATSSAIVGARAGR